jgi:hypothetical protein
MSATHQDIADLTRILREHQAAAAHAALERQVAHLAARAPYMVQEGGPGFVIETTVITLPGGARLRFEGTLEIMP